MIKLADDEIEFMKSWLYDYINDICIYRVAPHEPSLPALHPEHAPDGYTWLILSRKGLLDGKFATYVGLLFWNEFAEKYKENKFQITGLETASIPIMTAIAMTANVFGIDDINCFYFRKSPKEYGIKQTYEGIIDPDLPALVVDDFYNSRSTYMTVKRNLEDHNVKLYDDAFAIINKQWEIYDKDNPDAFRLMNQKLSENLNIVSLFKITDFELSHVKYYMKKFEKENSVDYETVT